MKLLPAKSYFSARLKKSQISFTLFLVSLVVMSLVTSNVSAQTQELEFKEYTVLDGNRLGKINSIIQDKNGFLWMSDQGNRAVLRYDGKQIKKFQYDPATPGSTKNLGGYYPECFYIEESGAIWIGFYGQGLDRYDPETNTFDHYKNDPANPQSLGNNFVTNIVKESDGKLWIATYSGLDLMDTETGVFTHYRNDPKDKNSLSCDTIRSMYKDQEGTLWIGTGMAWETNNRGGLNRYNPDTEDFTRFINDPKDSATLINNKVRAIFEDSRGVFWVGTGGDGLHTMDRKTGKFTRHRYDPDHPDKLSRPPLGNSGDRITFIREDAEGFIWIGTDANGINRYDPATGKVVHITDLFESGAWWMHVSHDKQIWISTNRAQLVRVNLFKYKITNIEKRLNTFVDSNREISWIGTNEGLIKLNKTTGEKTLLTHIPNDPSTITDNHISRLMTDSRGILWAGTWYGLNRIDPETGEAKRYQHNPEDSSTIVSDEITSICEDSLSNLWIGTPAGLEKYDPEKEIFTHYRTDFTNSNSLNGFIVTDIEAGPENTIWIALGANRGLNKLNVSTGKFDLYLHGFSVMQLYTDRHGIFWAGTSDGGLFKYQADIDGFKPTGIIEEALSMYEDDFSNIWVSTMVGIFKIYANRDHISFFESQIEGDGDGIFENLGVSYTEDSLLYMGHWAGYYVFDPQKLIENQDSTQVFVSEIRINNRSDQINAIYAYSPPNNNIVLDQEQNTFSVRLTETDYQDNVDEHIYYMLENYDVEWRKILPGEWIDYYKVPTGKYRLHIKSASSSGTWTENEFFVKILPPWWLSLRAYFAYSLFFIVGVFGVHRVQKSNTIRKERERIKDRELEQAKKIEEAYEELKATQSQLIQSEKMASLGELTAGIAHEIQNPLNFVNNFSEVNKELIEELKAERLKLKEERDEKLEEEILRDMEENENKILHHGKRADSIVKGMLQHSRAERGEKEPSDLNALADEYLRLAFHGLRAKDKSFNAEFKTNFDESLPKVNIVPQDIGRVLLNLINNAFYAVDKKAKEGIEEYKPLVVVSTKKLDNKIEISVKDNGPGIPDDIKDKIFQPFFTTKPTGSGTGLGLSMSYDIVKAHGGELKVETKDGEGLSAGQAGSEFIIQLPIT